MIKVLIASCIFFIKENNAFISKWHLKVKYRLCRLLIVTFGSHNIFKMCLPTNPLCNLLFHPNQPNYVTSAVVAAGSTQTISVGLCDFFFFKRNNLPAIREVKVQEIKINISNISKSVVF